MKVTLTRRLGLRSAGTQHDYPASEAEWLISRGYATADPTTADTTTAPATPAASDDTTPTTAPAGQSSEPTSPPPRSGQGSGRAAWATYAHQLGLTIPHGADRGDIITAITAAGHPTD